MSLHRILRPLTTATAALFGAGALVLTGAATAHADQTWSGSLSSAVDQLDTGTENRTGYTREAFKHWVDADGDGCSTRAEVLLAEADDAPTVSGSCTLSGGRWYSYYEGVSQSSASALDIDHMVPLAEAWDSGARSWSAARREAFANDLGDARSLVAVTASQNRSKGDQDVAEWLPPQQHCRYVKEWVATKIRWGLSADSTELGAIREVAGGCSGSLTVSIVD